MRRVWVAAVILANLFLSGCHASSATSTTAVGSSSSKYGPAGVYFDRAQDRPNSFVNGIYTGWTPNDPSCCFVIGDVRALSRIQAGDRFLLLKFYISGQYYLKHPQRLHIVTEDTAETLCCYSPGAYAVTVTLRKPATTDHYAEIRIRSDVAIVPKEHGMGPDMRRLAEIINEVRFTPNSPAYAMLYADGTLRRTDALSSQRVMTDRGEVYYPLGIDLAGDLGSQGISPTAKPDACCEAEPTSRFWVALPDDAAVMKLSVRFHESHPHGLTVQFPEEPATTQCCFTTDDFDVAFLVPVSAVSGPNRNVPILVKAFDNAPKRKPVRYLLRRIVFE